MNPNPAENCSRHPECSTAEIMANYQGILTEQEGSLRMWPIELLRTFNQIFHNPANADFFLRKMILRPNSKECGMRVSEI